jgi:hypothetical protein
MFRRLILGFRFRSQFPEMLHHRVRIDFPDRADFRFALVFQLAFVFQFVFHLGQSFFFVRGSTYRSRHDWFSSSSGLMRIGT